MMLAKVLFKERTQKPQGVIPTKVDLRTLFEERKQLEYEFDRTASIQILEKIVYIDENIQSILGRNEVVAKVLSQHANKGINPTPN
jgi:hypothetical protein